MKWLDNIQRVFENHTVGTCPYCGSNNTEYAAKKITKDNFGFCDIWCNECRHALHISRVKLDNTLINKKKTPKYLIYSK